MVVAATAADHSHPAADTSVAASAEPSLPGAVASKAAVSASEIAGLAMASASGIAVSALTTSDLAASVVPGEAGAGEAGVTHGVRGGTHGAHRAGAGNNLAVNPE